MGDLREQDRKLSWLEAYEECRAQIAWHERRIKVLEGCKMQFLQFHKDGWPFPTPDPPRKHFATGKRLGRPPKQTKEQANG